ncbi:hypothetical protein ZWY2020_051983 [Hordeum vulgare]|nr:hypothetical protein ZWY2020_051983 [Hordeum vulgare]
MQASIAVSCPSISLHRQPPWLPYGRYSSREEHRPPHSPAPGSLGCSHALPLAAPEHTAAGRCRIRESQPASPACRARARSPPRAIQAEVASIDQLQLQRRLKQGAAVASSAMEAAAQAQLHARSSPSPIFSLSSLNSSLLSLIPLFPGNQQHGDPLCIH